MGSNTNFKNFSNEPPSDGSRLPGNIALARQPSIYSLTFDELQSTMGGIGKDFGSMNMDELLKNVWSAEETQSMMAFSSGNPDGNNCLQRQGSLTLPRTLSQKTVDEVWKDISKECNVKDGSGGGGQGSNNMPQRQQTLGEMTLEEFLVRAGVVREDIQLGAGGGKVNNNTGFLGDLSRSINNTGPGIGFQQMGKGVNFMGNRNLDNSNQIGIQSSNLPLNVNGARMNQHPLAQQQPLPLPLPLPLQQQQPQHPQIFPKQATTVYASQMPLQSSPGFKSGIMGIGDQVMSSSLIQGGGMGMVGLGAGPVGVATGSPGNQLSSDGIGKSNGDTSSVSPVPYMFNVGLRGRKFNGNVEKVVERRHRRMIKNRESAARSRARKQAYTTELEAEVAKLKEENQELQKKQDEMMEMQKNEVLEMMNMQQGGKKLCLRRTQTGPW